MGFTEIIWDNLSGLVQQPAVANKQWSELTTCADADAGGGAGGGAWMLVPTHLLMWSSRAFMVMHVLLAELYFEPNFVILLTNATFELAHVQ